MTNVWEAIAAMSAALIICGSLIAIFVRLSIDSALMQFKSELLEALDERYILRIEHNAIHNTKQREQQ